MVLESVAKEAMKSSAGRAARETLGISLTDAITGGMKKHIPTPPPIKAEMPVSGESAAAIAGRVKVNNSPKTSPPVPQTPAPQPPSGGDRRSEMLAAWAGKSRSIEAERRLTNIQKVPRKKRMTDTVVRVSDRDEKILADPNSTPLQILGAEARVQARLPQADTTVTRNMSLWEDHVKNAQEAYNKALTKAEPEGRILSSPKQSFKTWLIRHWDPKHKDVWNSTFFGNPTTYNGALGRILGSHGISYKFSNGKDGFDKGMLLIPRIIEGEKNPEWVKFNLADAEDLIRSQFVKRTSYLGISFEPILRHKEKLATNRINRFIKEVYGEATMPGHLADNANFVKTIFEEQGLFKLTDKEKSRIRLLLDRGKSSDEIAAQLNIPKSTVDIHSLLQQGKSPADIAKEFGVSESIINIHALLDKGKSPVDIAKNFGYISKINSLIDKGKLSDKVAKKLSNPESIMKIFEMKEAGKSSAEIAKALGIPETIKGKIGKWLRIYKTPIQKVLKGEEFGILGYTNRINSLIEKGKLSDEVAEKLSNIESIMKIHSMKEAGKSSAEIAGAVGIHKSVVKEVLKGKELDPFADPTRWKPIKGLEDLYLTNVKNPLEIARAGFNSNKAHKDTLETAARLIQK